MRKKASLQIAKEPERLEQQYQSSREYLQVILDSLDDELMVIDQDFRVTQVNAALLKRHGCTASKVIGQPCYKVSHNSTQHCQPPACECPVTRVWETGKPVRVTHTHFYDTGEKSQERYIDILASPLIDSQGNITAVVALMRDVTEAKRLEQQTKEALQHLLTLNSVASTINQRLDLDTILNDTLDKVLELMKGDSGGIFLLDEESQILSSRAQRGLSDEVALEIAGLKSGEGISEKVTQPGQPIYVDDISEDASFSYPASIKEGIRAFARVPLQSKNKVLGIMNIARHSGRRFTPEDIHLLNSIGNQISIAIENAILYNEVQHKEEIRRKLLNLVISAQEEERKRIARGLHDETSQALTSLTINLETVIAMLPTNAGETAAKLRKMQSLAAKTLDEIHKIIYELRPTLLDDLGLVAAVRWHAENHLEAAGLKVHLEIMGLERRLPSPIETALFRTIQEATTNIVRHASAKSTYISFEFNDTSVAIHIEDDGTGFDLDKVMRINDGVRGLGLLSMKERVELLGGVLNIKSQPGLGTQIAVKIPVTQEVPDD